MATSIVISLDKRRPKEEGTFPIIFRLTHHTKTTGIASGYSTPKKFWDEKKRCFKRTFKGTESPQRLNNFFAKRKAKMVDILTKLDEKGELKFLSIKQLKERLIVSSNKQNVFSFIEMLIEDLIKSNRIGTALSYRDNLRAMKIFRNQKDFSFNEFNLDFLKKFETDYLSRGNSLGGLAVYMRTFRAIYNKAIKAGVAEQEGYPFRDYTIRKGKTRKRAISLEAIQKIKELELKPEAVLFKDRCIFLMSFYLRGMPYADLAHLKVSNIIDGRIQYDRQKTSEPFDIKIPDQLWPILEFFTKNKGKEDYVLPVIKRESPFLQYRDVEWARKRYNRNLKEIAQLAGIEERLTSYVPRHSYASIADEMGIPVTAISQMLGHEKVGTTQAYLNKLRKSKLDKYQDEVISGL